jgi:photosystem II stability/assembly factor-like uncharacterized protein
MKKLKLLSLVFLSITCTNAQWIVQQVPTTKALIDVYFADTSQGWVTGRDGIFHTTDSGNTWDLQYQGNTSYLSGLNDTEVWATSLRDTLLHSTNGGISWDIITINSFTGFDSTWSISTIYFFDTNIGWIQAEGWISGSMQNSRLLKTTDGGVTWEMSTPPYLGFDAFIQFFDSLYGYRTGSGIPFFRTTDGGETWDLVSWYGYMYTMSMQFLTKDIGWMSTDGPVLATYVIETTNGGEDWFGNITFECSALSTYISFVDTLTGWVVQWSCISPGTEIWHTSDGGTSWDLQFIYSPPFYFDPRDIFFVDSLHGWVVGDNGIVLHTSTGGIIPVELISFTAEVIEDGVKLEWTTATETNNQGFEIERASLSASPSQGWEKIGFVEGYGTTTEPRSYSFIDKEVATRIYKYRLKQIDFDGSFTYSNEIQVDVNLTPKEFLLYQNYPNPFNLNTVISYQLPVNSNVTLKVYDILGNEVATLVNEEKQPGIYEVEFDASSLASGIYLYQLKSGAFFQTNKMVLLR